MIATARFLRDLTTARIPRIPSDSENPTHPYECSWYINVGPKIPRILLTFHAQIAERVHLESGNQVTLPKVTLEDGGLLQSELQHFDKFIYLA
jgi:hypothetical protein